MSQIVFPESRVRTTRFREIYVHWFNGERSVRDGAVICSTDALVHVIFDAHLDHIASSGAEVLNLLLPADHRLPPAFRLGDHDRLARLSHSWSPSPPAPQRAPGLVRPPARAVRSRPWRTRAAPRCRPTSRGRSRSSAPSHPQSSKGPRLPSGPA